MSIEQFTQSNIEFLRTGINISSERLAIIAGIDIAELYKYQTQGVVFDTKPVDGLIRISNYFTIRLEDLIYSNLEGSVAFDRTVFDQIKAEINGGAAFDREKFKSQFLDILIDDEKEYEKAENDIAVMKQSFHVLHTLFMVQEQYDDLRSKGLISKIEFMEKHEEKAVV